MQSTPGRVAIVEDDAGMRRSLERLLQARGHATSAFASAEDFLRSPPASALAALVVDIQLPGMSGLELTRQLKLAGIVHPVVFITARGNAPARAEALALGCVDYLEKPFDAEALALALDRCAASGPPP